VEKFIHRSSQTKLSLIYSPQIICNCEKQCNNRNKDGSYKSSCSSNFSSTTPGSIEYKDLLTCYDEEYFSNNSIEHIQHKISNYFKILYLRNKMNKTFIVSSTPIHQPARNNSENSEKFFTCNEFDTLSSVEPYSTCLRERMRNKILDLNQLIIFLNNCERNSTIKIVKDLLMLDLRKILHSAFKTFNKYLFNNFLVDLSVRWTKHKQYVLVYIFVKLLFYYFSESYIFTFCYLFRSI
jgi:hypothetical protein